MSLMDEYLMFELSDAVDYFDDVDMQIQEICVVLAASSDLMSETFLRMYTEGLKVDQANLAIAIAFFSGLDLLHIVCDCEASDKPLCDFHYVGHNRYYEAGMDSLQKKDNIYFEMTQRVAAMRRDINGATDVQLN